MKRIDQVEHAAYRAALSSGRWVIALSMLVSTAMHPEDLTELEMESVLDRYHELCATVQ
ncbi:MAG: hypothetical protein KAJ13_12290 [Gemmatimonadetes bacterium]|jgi:hypothetical protein|nr:hypothetical protein [Gemmatimonadota bacterium]